MDKNTTNPAFEPKLAGLWDFRFIDSGTGTSVYRAKSLLGERAVKFFNMEGSESITEQMVKIYQKHTKEVSKWMSEMREDLKVQTFEDSGKKLKFVWRINPVLDTGVKNFNGKQIPYTVSPWVTGVPLSDYRDGVAVPKGLEDLDNVKTLTFLTDAVSKKAKQYRFTYYQTISQNFIPVYRNILITEEKPNVLGLVVVDIRDYLNTRNQPIKSFSKFRTRG